MKNIYNKFLFSSLSLATLLFVSCSKDDYTGYSTVEVANGAKLTVTSDFASPKTIVEGDNKYTLTVSIDKPQSFDVVVKINQISGTASTDDYTVEGKITIPAYKTSATTELVILKDDLKEDIETLKLQIGDDTTANASLTPVTVEFNIQNYTEGSLIADLSWETTIKDVNGDLIKATTAADFKLRITNLDFSNVDVVDDSKTTFESYEMLASLADGEYLVVAEPISFLNLGAQGDFDIDIKVDFNQVGLYNNESYVFKKAFSSAGMTSCGATGFLKLAKITKLGSSYAISKIGEIESKFKANLFTGNWSVTTDINGLEDPFTTTFTENKLIINGIGRTFIGPAFWDETITENFPIELSISDKGEVSIKRQKIYTTSYRGDLTTYDIIGSGKLNICGSKPVLTLSYDIYSPGSTNGLAKTYKAYLTEGVLGGVFTLN